MILTNNRSDTQGQPAASHGVYGISVAAELSGIPVQSLRLYESHGLLTPVRSDGGTRRYSADDLARLRRISELVAAGVNLAGIEQHPRPPRRQRGTARREPRIQRESGAQDQAELRPGGLPVPGVLGILSCHEFGALRGPHRRGRLRRYRRGNPAQAPGYRRLRHPRPGGRPRRNLACQPLPGSGRRCPHHHVLVLLRAEPELVAVVHPGAGDQAVRRGRGRQVRRAPAHAVQHRRRKRPLGRRDPPLAGGAVRWRRAVGALPDHRHRVPVPAENTRHSGDHDVRGQGHPHHRVGGRLRSDAASGSGSSGPAQRRCS